MALLADTAAVSRRVAETSSRLEKIRELAEHLRGLDPGEVPIAIGFLTGEPRQGRPGVSYAALRSAGSVAVLDRARFVISSSLMACVGWMVSTISTASGSPPNSSESQSVVHSAPSQY